MKLMKLGTNQVSKDCAAEVCCSVLQCVAVCCSVLQCVAVCSSVLQCVAVCLPVCCSVLKLRLNEVNEVRNE